MHHYADASRYVVLVVDLFVSNPYWHGVSGRVLNHGIRH